MNKISFSANEEGGYELVRTIMLERLRRDNNWQQLNSYDPGFDPYVEYIGNSRTKLLVLLQDVFWEFIIQGIIAPGSNLSNPNLPWFHITEYGRKVLGSGELLPHDPTNYLQRFREDVGAVDSTVEAYVSESLNCFIKGNHIASVVMLGVASERAFLLLCDAFLNAVSDPTEKNRFSAIIRANAIKPKEDWVLNKIQDLQKARPRPLPDNVNIMLTVIFDFIRSQRNNLGHPQETPPKTTREEAFVNLRIFPGYYKMLNQVMDYLSRNNV